MSQETWLIFSLLIFVFSLAKAQSRKEIYLRTALISCFSALACLSADRFLASCFFVLGCFLLFARKGAKPQRNLTANGSNFLLLVSCFLSLASCLLSLFSFLSQRRRDAKKSMRNGSGFSALVSCLLLLDTSYLILIFVLGT